jgi:hypothetical protein
MEFVPAATFWYPDEALVARGLLRSAGVICYLENEHVLTWVWTWNCALGGLRLMVPGPDLAETRQLLEEPLIGDPPHARIGPLARALLTFAIISSPMVTSLHLLYVVQ